MACRGKREIVWSGHCELLKLVSKSFLLPQKKLKKFLIGGRKRLPIFLYPGELVTTPGALLSPGSSPQDTRGDLGKGHITNIILPFIHSLYRGVCFGFIEK